MEETRQLHATPEMVLMIGLVRNVLPEFPRHKRRRIMRRMDTWFTKLNGRAPWRVMRYIGEGVDDTVMTSRDEAGAWWTMVRDALARDMD